MILFMTDPTDTAQGKGWEVGQRVALKGDHPWQGYDGFIVRLEKIQIFDKVRPVVRLEGIPNQECFIMRDDQAELVK